MTQKIADRWFDDIEFVSIVSTIKDVMTSDGTMSILLDFERVLDDCDIYAYKNWIIGELVQGPIVGRYDVSCVFMWPYKLMPNPKAVKRLFKLGCQVQWTKKNIMVPVEVKNYEDFVQGTNYPKGIKRKVWLVKITIPMDLMDDIKEGSIDLAGNNIDLEEIEKAYDDDLDKQGTQKGENDESELSQLNMTASASPGTPVV